MCLLIVFLTAFAMSLIGYRSRSFFRIESCTTNFKSYVFYSIFISLKLVAGFMHASVDNPFIRIYFLTVLSAVGLVMLCFVRKCFSLKSNYFLLFMYSLCKFLVHLVLILEVYLS